MIPWSWRISSATKPVVHNYSAQQLQLLKPVGLKPTLRNERRPSTAPGARLPEAMKTPGQTKINTQIIKFFTFQGKVEGKFSFFKIEE